jgi:hypoxanthine phosphoribosyltransferase
MPYKELLSEILVDETNLQRRIAELGKEISKDYAGQDLLLICLLRGAVLFLTDLMRQIDIPHTIDFMAVSSYGEGARESSGSVRITMDIRTDIRDKNVLIIEDIIDSGNTLSSVMDLLQARNPKSLRACTLLDKTERREVDVPIQYVGFDIKDKFVFGYGLDLDEYYRDLPFIGVVDLEKYQPQD